MNTNEPTRPNEIKGAESDTVPDRAVDRAVDPLDQMLVAYLDGELSDAETEKIDAQLSQDSQMRLRLHELQTTWDMLDELPRTEPDRSFLKSTIEMVVTSAQTKKTKWHRWPIRMGAMATAFLFAALIAFQIVRSMQTEPYRQFVTDLDFLENADMYDQIQEVAFLEELYKSGVFSESTETVDISFLDLPNQIRLDSLDVFEISRVKQSRDAFNLKPPQNQKLLREIHDHIFSRPDRDKLLATMRLYSQWLSTVDSKHQLKELPVESRVSRVIEIRQQQAEARFGREGETSLPPEDVARFFEWCSEFCESKKAVMVELLFEEWAERSPESARPRSPDFEKNLRAETIFTILRGLDEQKALDVIEPDDVSKLQAVLTEGSALNLSKQTLPGQKKLVGRWLTGAIEAKYQRDVEDSVLLEFYETTMTEEERMKIEGLPPKRARASILRLYDDYFPSQEDEAWKYFRLDRRRGGRSRWNSRDSRGKDGRRGKQDPRD